MNYYTNNFLETKKLGEEIVKKIKPSKRGATVFCLKGDLGAGKTTFLQGFGIGLKIKEKIQSPTFIIMNRHVLKNNNFKNFFHFDCYRLEKPKEIINLGFKEIIANPDNLVAIEWSSKIEKILPNQRTEIVFETIEQEKRKITVKIIK